MTDTPLPLRKHVMATLRKSSALGAKPRKGGVRQTRFVSDSLLTALNGVPPGAVAEKPLLLKAFVVGAAGYPSQFETIAAS